MPWYLDAAAGSAVSASAKKADLDDVEDGDVLRLVILFGASMC